MLLKYCTLLRLCHREGRFIIARQCSVPVKINNEAAAPKRKSLNALIEKHRSKILFNTYLDGEKLVMGEMNYHFREKRKKNAEERHKYAIKCAEPLPVALKYLLPQERLLSEPIEETFEDGDDVTTSDDKVINFPYQVTEAYRGWKKDERGWMKNYEYFDDTKLDEDGVIHPEQPRSRRGRARPSRINIKEATDDEKNNETEAVQQNQEVVEEEDHEWRIRYGTPDPSQQISNVQCYGCGALLHCCDTTVPGYIPSEIFNKCSERHLKTTECQRCHFLQKFKVALYMRVPPEEYPKLLSSIKNKRGLVVIMVDLLDFPGSLWPDIFDIIGNNKSVIIVGNKVDLLPQDSKGYLKHIEECIITQVKSLNKDATNIKCVTLISAKTGYGIEELITCMHFFWKDTGDTYLVGCTNVGKSSLFNALLQSDYCKVQAVDLMKRATVSNWPGTTLNMLKFPVQKPTDWRMYARNKRLMEQKADLMAESSLRRIQLQQSNNPKFAALIGRIGRTFHDETDLVDLGTPNPYSMAGKDRLDDGSCKVFNEKDEAFVHGRWCYDTPGIIQPQQLVKYLTTEELMMALPKHILQPRNFYLYPGDTLFLGGIARIDFLGTDDPVRLTVMASELLPVTVCKTKHSEELYEAFIGTEFLTVPKGGAERLKQWPGLSKLDDEFALEGVHWRKSVADFAFSSIGWVAVTPGDKRIARFAIWSPERRGVSLRTPPLLPYIVNIRGSRVSNSPAYRLGKLHKGLTQRYDAIIR